MAHEPGHPEAGWQLLRNPNSLDGSWGSSKADKDEAESMAYDFHPKIAANLLQTVINSEDAPEGRKYWYVKTPTVSPTAREAREDLHRNKAKLQEFYEAQGMVFEDVAGSGEGYLKGQFKMAKATHAISFDQRTQNYQIRPLEGAEPEEDWEMYQHTDGSFVLYDKNSAKTQKIPPDLKPLNYRPDVTKADIKLLKTVELGDETRVEFYQVGNKIEQYKVDTRKAAPAIDPSQNQVNVPGYGTFFNVGPNQFDFIPLKDDPFVPNNAINVPDLNGTMIQTSPNQWQFVRDSYEPGVKIDPRTGVKFTQDANGTWREMAYQTDPGVVQIGDREFLQQPTGAMAELAPRYDPGVVRDPSGLTLIQQPSGAVTQARAANMNELIAQALVDGQVEKAFAFADFRDRPTATEAMQTALEYARSPADQQVISSLARGETPVREPDAGVIQRVGPRPDFLVQAYQDFQRRTQAGRAPTTEEAQQLTERAATGQSPTTDKLKIEAQTLQARLEKIALDTEITREKHQAEMSQRQELHNTKIRELTQKVNNAQEKARLEQEYITTRQNGNGGGAATGNGTRTTSGSQPDNTLADANISYNTSTRAITVEDEDGDATTFKNIDDLMEAYTGETDLYNVTHPSRDAGTGTNYDTGRALQVLKTQGLEDAIAYTENQMQRAKETMYADVGGPWGVQIPWNHWAIQEYGESEEGLKNFQDDAAKAGITDLFQAGRQFKSPDDLSMQARAAQDPGRFEDVQAGPTAADTFRQAIEDMQKQRSFEDEYTAPSGPITSISGPRSIRSSVEIDDTDDDDSAYRGGGPVGAPAADFSFSAPSKPAPSPVKEDWGGWVDEFAGGGMTRGNNLELVGEEGPELVDLPPGSFVLPLKQLNHKQMLDLKRKGVRGYQSGGIVFDDNQTQSATLPFGLRQMQAGRPITPSRGYLSQQAGLRLPSAQAFQNITPESREVFLDLAAQAGIPRKSFAQELALTVPSGRRLPVARIAPVQRRAIQ